MRALFATKIMRMPPQLVMRMPPQLESRSRLAEFDSARRRIGEDASNVVDFVVFDEQDEARTALGIRFVEFGALILTDDAIDGICIGKIFFGDCPRIAHFVRRFSIRRAPDDRATDGYG